LKYIILLFSYTGFLFSDDITTNYNIKGMMCGVSCPKAIYKSLDGVEGIKSCKVDFDTKTAVIVYDDNKINSKKIASTIEKHTYFKVKNSSNKEKWSLFKWFFKKS
tara:strand:+ start:1610 stop:1927 length:318 start_codon:yes stop_codon:yes gene_type:complete